MGKLSNFFNLFKHNASSQSNDDKIISEHESIDINLKDNNYNSNQIEGNKDINMLKEQKGLSVTPSNESDFLKLFKYDPITDSSKTFNIETALNNNWDKIDTFSMNVNQQMEEKANKQFKQHNGINTIGWKRIASCNNYNTFGTFTIYNNYNTAQPNVFEVSAIKNYGNRASIIQTNATIGGDNIISKIRIIHDNTKAYLEIYYTKSVGNNIYVTLENFNGWVLLNVIEEGSIPSGYNVQELTIVDKGMSINDRPVATLVDLEEKADKDLLQFKNANFKLPADLPNSYPNGFSAFYGSAADWGVGVIGSNYGAIVETFKFSNGYSRQTISSTPAFPIKYRTSGTNNVWGTWQEIATSADMEQITDKGYVNAKVVTNLNDALENGKYKIIISGHGIITAGTYLVDTTKYDATASSQILRNVNVNGANTTYIRLYRAGVETVRLIATTEKINILFTPTVGLTVIHNNCYKINNIAYISIAIKKNDETAFSTGAQILGALGNKPLKSEALSVYCFANVTLGSSVGGTSAYADDSIGNLVTYNNSASTKSLIVTGSYCIG